MRATSAKISKEARDDEVFSHRRLFFIFMCPEMCGTAFSFVAKFVFIESAVVQRDG